MDCVNYNQYYSDVVINGKVINDKCFKGSSIYKKTFNINNYQNYNGKDYYSWINSNFKEYAFPDESLEEYTTICNPAKYALKPQQKFVARVLNTNVQNTGLLVYHGLGSGKTQTSIIIGEAFKFRNTNGGIINNRADTRVFIVVPVALVDQYYAEIIGRIEDGTIKSATGEVLINGDRQYYLDHLIRDTLTAKYLEIDNLKKENSMESERKIKLIQKDIVRLSEEERLKVTTVYEIISHVTFLNRLFTYSNKEFTPGAYLEKLNVSNGLLIIDEIQNLVSAIGTSYRKLLYALRFYANKNFKVVLLTGTPIYDKPFEFGLLMNLLRPRMPFPDGFDAFNDIFLESDKTLIKNRELFKQMCSGYISYFKGGNPEAYPYKKTTIMHHSMNPYQYSIYKKALIAEVQKDKKEKFMSNQDFIVRIATSESMTDEVNSGIFNNSNLFSNIAFPEAKLTPDEIKHMTRESVLQAGLREFKNVLKNQQSNDPKIQNILTTVSTFSEKFAKVAELILKSPGPVFVYSNYVYFGVDAMAIVMDHIGFKEYPYSGPNGSYFVWKGKAKEELIPKAKKLFNSPENKNGKLLKIMFGTQTVMEGVDFRNVRQVHILDPWWNDSRVQQIIARGIRLCSHRDLPASERIVDVFIHLSTLGSAQSIYKLKVKKLDPTKLKEVESSVISFLQRENPDEILPNKWVFREAYVKLNKENEGTILPSKETFLASKIVNNSIVKLPDPSLTRSFGSHKNLDSISVQQYMYSIALRKLKVNRQFEKAIKEVAIDCTINKNGNVVRLDELYTPSDVYGIYNLEYENYQSGDRYVRLDVATVFTIDDILNNIALSSNKYTFKNILTSEEIKLKKSLVVFENINCGSGDYTFDGSIPKSIINNTLNKELIPQLMKLNIAQIKQYFYAVQTHQTNSRDPALNKKINLFLSKDSVFQKEEIIKKFVALGIGEESVWELYPLDQLKKEYAIIKKLKK
jgi:superfamily II DNA or RNA helicase